MNIKLQELEKKLYDAKIAFDRAIRNEMVSIAVEAKMDEIAFPAIGGRYWIQNKMHCHVKELDALDDYYIHCMRPMGCFTGKWTREKGWQ